MNKLKDPTHEDWFDEYLESVQKDVDNSWRHGCYVYEVFHRDADDTYWAVNYKVSGDGETHTLREGLEKFTQVYPNEKVVTTVEYTTTP